MILTGEEIKKEVMNRRIVIDPYKEDCVQTNSYDFHLGDTLRIYKSYILDANKENETMEIKIPSDGLILDPEKLYLGSTSETIGSDFYVPIIRGKSSTGRLGIFVNITADLISIGTIQRCMLMLHSVVPVRIYPNMKIGQVTFWVPKGEIYDVTKLSPVLSH